MMLKHDGVLSFHSMTDKDVMSVYELERECFSVPWSIKSISEELQNANARFLLAEINGETAGYVGSYFVSGEVYITNVAVKNKYRRKGVAVGLLSELIDLAKEAKSEFVSLEVRCSNTLVPRPLPRCLHTVKARENRFRRFSLLQERAYVLSKQN
jgi:[ribosomal protein S18]-alanine N-acetyltransferase